MHYIAILYERTRQSRGTTGPAIELRGYSPKTWIPAELSEVELPVYALAYTPCPRFRDVYLEWVLETPITPTWGRYQGRVIDEVYKLIHERCEEYASGTRTRNFDLYNHLIREQNAILANAKNKYQRELSQIQTQPDESVTQAFDEALKKIIRFEAEITSAFINFEIAKIESANPHQIFTEYFNFNTDFALSARNQGFRTPATPDFIYRHEVIGDIKSGKWQHFLEYTIVAYTLAYEEHTGHDMNYGAILHVELPTSRLVPAHYRAGIKFLDDYKRKRFILMRDRKLEIVSQGLDPGKPDSQNECDTECPFLSYCWGDKE